jgi:light-regulated signal transduction histidine kinase (bacteriophytochrome)
MSQIREDYSATDIAELRHGLRTPLNHIIGYVEMMHEDALQLEFAEAASGLQQVLHQAQHICDLIQKHTIFSQRSVTDADLDGLRTELQEPVNHLRQTVAGLTRLPVANAMADLVRINQAASELVEFSAFGKRPASPSVSVRQSTLRPISARGHGHLLVVDDDETNRDILKRHLERQGYSVEESASGSDAVAKLRAIPFDAVLLDLVMPEMNGLDVLRVLKQDNTLFNIPVLVISASDELVSVAESIKSGAEDYLFKPFDPVLLRARLSATLDRKRLRDEERMRSAELEKVTQALKRSNEDLQRFAYAASHDLQAPIRTITSYLQLLARRLGSRLSADEHEMISFATDAAKRMSTLVQDLLLYSQVSTRPRTLESVDCDALLRTLVHDLKSIVEESQAEVRWDSLPNVHAEHSSLRQLLQNLVGNAIKYHGPEAPRIRITASREGEFWVFCVWDNGLGIAPEYKQRIFEMFERLHGEELPGSGIGLAMCRRIVERFGGRIWVESEVGVGSRFYFTVPVSPSAQSTSN